MIRYFAGHPTAANLLMHGVMLLGLLAVPQLQRDTFPVVPPTEVEIRVPYPGASPADVELGICEAIEGALDGVMNLQEVRCDARENLAIATAQMRESAPMTDFYDDVKSQIEAITSFPAKVERAAIVKLERTATVASLAITSKMPAADLKAYAEQVKTRLKSDPRIAQVRIQGFSDQEVTIELRREVLARYGISLTDVQAAIARQSLDLPSGALQTRDGDLIVRFADARVTPAGFADLVVVGNRQGTRIRLGDIAEVGTGFDRPEQRLRFDGERAALLEVSKTDDQDSLRVMAALREHLDRERELAPTGLTIEISGDVTGNIRDRLNILVSNGLQGLVLVFLAMWAFFPLRFSFWVTMGLPVAFLGAVFAMNLLGYTLNMMTMVALLVAIGLLMDDAIVISENVAAHRQRGKSPMAAAIDGTVQVMPGVLASFLTTAMIVGPLAFLSGKMGAVLKVMPAVLLITLAVSLIEAFLILPAHLHHAMAGKTATGLSGMQAWIDRRFSALRDHVFLPLVDAAVLRPWLWLGILLAAALISFATMPAGWLKYQAFPNLESDIIQARILLPQGTPLERTEAVVSRVADAVRTLDNEMSPRQPDGQRLVTHVTEMFDVNVDAYESGPHVATVSADLLAADKRNGTVDELLARWRELVGNMPDVVSLKFTDKERGVAGKAIDLRLQGDDLAALKRASVQLQDFLRRYDGVTDLSDDLRPGKPELRVSLKDSATVFGVTAAAVANELRAALLGATGIEVRAGGETYDVAVRLAAADRATVDAIRDLRIRAGDGSLVPLAAVADVQQTRGPARIHRVDGVRTVTVQGSIDTARVNARELMNAVTTLFAPELAARHPGIRMVSQGQDRETAETGSSLVVNMLVGVVGIYLILSFLFRDYIQPLAVMLAIPMGWIGVTWGHLAMGLDLTMPSLVGFATLAGVVVNDNILLVDFIKARLAAGEPITSTVRAAARDRFRPIALTSVTTVAGLLPLLLETSTQAQLLTPLVASLAFGLMTATVSSLVLVPVFFAILDDLGWLGRESRPADPAGEQITAST